MKKAQSMLKPVATKLLNHFVCGKKIFTLYSLHQWYEVSIKNFENSKPISNEIFPDSLIVTIIVQARTVCHMYFMGFGPLSVDI